MMMVAGGRLDGVGGQVVWGQSILYDIFLYFIDMNPGELNAIMASAVDVCLVDDWLVWHLILWLTVKDGMGWGWWSHGSTHGALPTIPHPPSIPFIPSSLLLPAFIYPFCCYISLIVSFPTQKSPVKCGLVRFKGFYCAKSHINAKKAKNVHLLSTLTADRGGDSLWCHLLRQ